MDDMIAESEKQPLELSVEEPWVEIYNPYYRRPEDGGGQTFRILIIPFPYEDFPPHCPWQNNVVLAWSQAAEKIANHAGWPGVPAYVQDLIRQAADPARWQWNGENYSRI